VKEAYGYDNLTREQLYLEFQYAEGEGDYNFMWLRKNKLSIKQYTKTRNCKIAQPHSAAILFDRRNENSVR